MLPQRGELDHQRILGASGAGSLETRLRRSYDLGVRTLLAVIGTLGALVAAPGCASPIPSQRAFWLGAGPAEGEEGAPGGSWSRDTGAPLEQIGESVAPDTSDEVFTVDRVLSLDITLSDEAIAALTADPYTFVEGSVVLDGDALDGVGLRIGGKLGSYRSFGGKPGFKLDLNFVDSDRRWHGLKRLNVKNMVQDYSFVHDRTAFMVYRAMGVPAPRVGYLWVTLNGATLGLYSNVEATDELFLERNYEDPTGNLYDGDYLLSADRSSYTFIDFNSASQDLFDLDEGEDVGFADVHAVTEAIAAVGRGEGSWQELVGARVDLDHHMAMMATEFWSGQYDGYSNNRNNYRVYFDPLDGLARISPWDHDWAFYDAMPMTPQVGALSTGCWSDADCKAAFLAEITEVCAVVAGMGLRAEVDAAVALIDPYVQADPRREIGYDTALAYQEHLRNWIAGRAATLAATYGVECVSPE